MGSDGERPPECEADAAGARACLHPRRDAALLRSAAKDLVARQHPRRRAAALWTTVLLAGTLASRAGALPGDVLVESRFARGSDDWHAELENPRGGGAAPMQLELDKGSQRLKGGDMGDALWYFVAPGKFLGDQRAWFHGELQYQLGHFVFDMTDGPPSTAVPDVVLESKAKRLKLGARGVIRPNVAAHTYSVPFSAEAFDKICRSGASSDTCAGKGDACTTDDDCCSKQCVATGSRWYNLKTGRAARNSEVLAALSAVSVLKVRGGYYRGGVERTWLKNPLVIEGGLTNRTDAAPAPGPTPSDPLSAPGDLLSTPKGREPGAADGALSQARSGRTGAPPARRSARSAACKVRRTHVMTLRPGGASQCFNQEFRRPWSHAMRFPNMPEVCTDATLVVEAAGDLLGENKWVQVTGEDGTLLGKLFVTAVDGADGESSACVLGSDGPLGADGDCEPYMGTTQYLDGRGQAFRQVVTAPAGAERNATLLMADEDVNVFAVQDGLVVPRALMAKYTADGALSFGLRVEEGSKADVVTVISASIEFGIGGCYTRHAIAFPGLHRTPARYSGYYTSLRIPSPVPPDDDGAVMLNATGVLAPATSWVSVAVSNVSDPGAFGPAFRARPFARGRPDGNREGHPGVDVPGSQADIEPTGRAWELLEATRVFDTRGAGEEAAGEAAAAGWNSTLKAAGGVPRRVLQAMAEGEGGDGAGGALLAVLANAHPDEPSHTDHLSLWEASLVYPPERCHVHTLAEGGGGSVRGLMGTPLEREIEYCDDFWKCDSVGPSNNEMYSSEALCKAHCWRQRVHSQEHTFDQLDWYEPSPGLCYKPLKPMGQCSAADEVCSCTRLGVAECVDPADPTTRKLADGPADDKCRCLPYDDCTRTDVNVSYPFVFSTPAPPAGDVLLFVEASLPRPMTWHHYLRVRLTEGDGRTLGHVFSKPDCQWQCRELYTDNDPALPLLDAVRIPEELAREWMADGALEVAVEIDMPRAAVSCAMHPEDPRCFPYLSRNSGNEAIVHALFDLAAGSSTGLTQAAAAGDTTLKVASSAAAGLASGMFDCLPGLSHLEQACPKVHVQVCTPMGAGRAASCELLQVTAFHATDLPVVRAAGGTSALPHPLGRCACSPGAGSGCESKATQADCTGAGGTWDATTVRAVDAKILPALANEGEFTLRSLTLSYAVK